MVSRNISNKFTAAGRNLYLHKGTVLRAVLLRLFYCVVFFRNKAIPGNFRMYHENI